DLHRVELVARQQEAEDLAGDRPGAGADLEDARRAARLAKLRGQGPCEEAGAGQDGPRGTEVTAAFAEEVPTLLEEAHPRGLARAEPQGGPSRRIAAGSIQFSAPRATGNRLPTRGPTRHTGTPVPARLPPPPRSTAGVRQGRQGRCLGASCEGQIV